MVPGDPVPGLINNGWLFVANDAHGIAKRLHEKYPDARLAFHPNHYEGKDRLGVAEWFRVQHLSKKDAGELEDAMETPMADAGGFWCISARPVDLYTGQPLCGEPDERVIHACDRADNRRRADPFNARKYVETMHKRHEALEAGRREAMRDEMHDKAEFWHYHHVRHKGDHYPRIYVPNGV